MASSDVDNITGSEYKLYDTFLQRCQYNKGHGFRKAKLSREDVKSIIRSNDNSTIEAIKNILDKFQKVNLKFVLNGKFVSSNAIAQYIYDPEEDIFVCSITEEVYTVLSDYNNNGGYSPVNLRLVKNAKTYYTQKIYGILRRWSRTGETVTCRYTLDEIRSVCDIFPGTYAQYKYFKSKVLVPSINEINNKLKMNVTFTEIKKVRKVVAIEFSVTDYEPRKYHFEQLELCIDADYDVPSEDENKEPEIDSIDYMHLIDLRLNESIHEQFLKDYSDYKNYMAAVETASSKTLTSLGSKTINKRNYKYFCTTLDNLIPSESLHMMD